MKPQTEVLSLGSYQKVHRIESIELETEGNLMRKFLLMVAVGALVLTVAAPAMAIDFKFGAEYRVRFTTTVNGSSASNLYQNVAGSNPRSVQLRVRPIFDTSDDNGNITARLRLEVGDVEFGNGGGASAETNGVALSGGSARVGNGSGGGFGNDGINVETKSAYLDWAMPFGIPLRVRAGIQPWFLPKGLIVDDDVAGVRAYGTVKPISYETFWYRLNGGANTATVPAGAAGQVATSNTKDNNYDVYGGKIDVAIAPWLNPGVYGLYADNRVNCTGEGASAGQTSSSGSGLVGSAICSDRVRGGYWVGATITGALPIVSYDLDFVYGHAQGGPTGAFGDPTKAGGAVANPVDVKGWVVDGAVHIPVGPIKVNVYGSYATGDKQDGGDSEAYPSLAAGWGGSQGCGGIGGYCYEIIGTGGVFDQVEVTQDSPVNLWTAGASVEYVPVKPLWLRLGYVYAGFSRLSGNCAANNIKASNPTGACFGPAYTTKAGSKALGHEFHIRADYTVWTGFTLMGQLGWLVPAGGVPTGFQKKTMAEYVFQMRYNF